MGKSTYSPLPLRNIDEDSKNRIIKTNFEQSYQLHNMWARKISEIIDSMVTKEDVIYLSAHPTYLYFNTTRITSADSPYDILNNDCIVYSDTDGGAITVNLPAGIDGRYLRIINCGTGGNNTTVSPAGAELLFGLNIDYILTDGEAIEIVNETTEGWW